MPRTQPYRYDGLLSDFYEAIPTIGKRRDVQFYVRQARAAKGPILELGCGTGRVLIPTAAAGCRIVGLDFSPAMLARCAKKLREQPRSVQRRARLVRANMTRFHLSHKFVLVTIPFRSFQHLVTVREQLACLRCIHRHLRPSGKLIFDVLRTTPEAAVDRRWRKERAVGGEVRLADGARLRVTSRVVRSYPAEQYNVLDTIFYVTPPRARRRRVVHTFPFRYVYRFEAEHLLARVGFRVLHVFGDFSGGPLTRDYGSLVIVAQKIRARGHARYGQNLRG